MDLACGRAGAGFFRLRPCPSVCRRPAPRHRRRRGPGRADSRARGGEHLVRRHGPGRRPDAHDPHAGWLRGDAAPPRRALGRTRGRGGRGPDRRGRRRRWLGLPRRPRGRRSPGLRRPARVPAGPRGACGRPAPAGACRGAGRRAGSSAVAGRRTGSGAGGRRDAARRGAGARADAAACGPPRGPLPVGRPFGRGPRIRSRTGGGPDAFSGSRRACRAGGRTGAGRVARTGARRRARIGTTGRGRCPRSCSAAARAGPPAVGAERSDYGSGSRPCAAGSGAARLAACLAGCGAGAAPRPGGRDGSGGGVGSRRACAGARSHRCGARHAYPAVALRAVTCRFDRTGSPARAAKGRAPAAGRPAQGRTARCSACGCCAVRPSCTCCSPRDRAPSCHGSSGASPRGRPPAPGAPGAARGRAGAPRSDWSRARGRGWHRRPPSYHPEA